MDLPPLSSEQLSKLATSNAPPSQLFDVLSEYETEACLLSGGSETADSDAQLLSLFYSSFFIAHLLTDQIPEARALTQRMPEPLLHQDVSLQNCLTLLRAVWQMQHDQVYQILRGLPWPDILQPLIQRYESYFQDKTLIEVSRAYEAIRPATAAKYLGLDQQAAEKGDRSIIQKFTACEWTWDPEAELLYPKPIAAPHTEHRSTNGIREVMALLGTRGS